MWRCVNNIFAYCAGEPAGEEAITRSSFSTYGGKLLEYSSLQKQCKNNPKHCKLYRTVQQTYSKELSQTAV